MKKPNRLIRTVIGAISVVELEDPILPTDPLFLCPDGSNSLEKGQSINVLWHIFVTITCVYYYNYCYYSYGCFYYNYYCYCCYTINKCDACNGQDLKPSGFMLHAQHMADFILLSNLNPDPEEREYQYPLSPSSSLHTFRLSTEQEANANSDLSFSSLILLMPSVRGHCPGTPAKPG